MADISFQKPTDQPTGTARLIDKLRNAMHSDCFRVLRIMVAFAKVGPLLRLEADIQNWKREGKEIHAIIGVDQRGTSKEALDFALANFDETHIAHVNGAFSPTFHPKIYLFHGSSRALAFVGSNNLTVGGLETNLESNIRLALDLPADAALYSDLIGLWHDSLRICSVLNSTFLQKLVSSKLVIEEGQMRRLAGTNANSERSTLGPPEDIPEFPLLTIVPPSSVPPSAISNRSKQGHTPQRRPTPLADLTQPSLAAEALVMQIAPHGNGEVFLSKKAVDQNHDFFAWPFTGQTTPKQSSNQPYPQRIPDPIVRLRVIDATGNLIVEHDPFNLNTVYYSTKSEIRVTVPSDVVRSTPEYSILFMQQVSRPGYDYDMDIYVPGSTQYETYLQRCNQTMPSGGRTQPRRFGWI